MAGPVAAAASAGQHLFGVCSTCRPRAAREPRRLLAHTPVRVAVVTAPPWVVARRLALLSPRNALYTGLYAVWFVAILLLVLLRFAQATPVLAARLPAWMRSSFAGAGATASAGSAGAVRLPDDDGDSGVDPLDGDASGSRGGVVLEGNQPYRRRFDSDPDNDAL